MIYKQRLPYPWRQFDDTLCRVLTDALQHINQVRIGLNVLQLAGRQQTLNDAGPLISNFRPGKQPVSPTQWNRSQTAFSRCISAAKALMARLRRVAYWAMRQKRRSAWGAASGCRYDGSLCSTQTSVDDDRVFHSGFKNKYSRREFTNFFVAKGHLKVTLKILITFLFKPAFQTIERSE